MTSSLSEYRRIVSALGPIGVEAVMLLEEYRRLIWQMKNYAEMIAETQTEMHSVQLHWIQMIVDTGNQVEFASEIDSNPVGNPHVPRNYESR